MAKLAFVDSHVHFWNLKDPSLRYVWLDAEQEHPVLGDIDGLKVLRYSADEYVAETRFQNVTKVVHVQAAIGISDPVNETKWLQEQTDRTGFPHAVVAHCDLAGTEADATLERHLMYPNVRGIRDFGRGNYLEDREWRAGYSLLGGHGLVFCLDVVWQDMPKARALADAYPDVTLCVDHAGFPRSRDDAYFRSWRQGLEVVAAAPNTVCKISGLGMCDHRWTVDSLRPWALACIEIFGVDRCLFGTNWPVDRLYSSYGDVVSAYAEIISDLTVEEQTLLFSGNAERIFRM